ncbi:hypothetical protein OG357_35860 [Streptomyces sp. NBC_01255]|uniref:hypothetical protein n=1 Tax=Streptomyces sp. NBC_01255 TaxID=2903798 RepID=UPI002E35EBFE|nr:hypothetical protein [Streptomyces sp. NBC_01255]
MTYRPASADAPVHRCLRVVRDTPLSSDEVYAAVAADPTAASCPHRADEWVGAC